jgi:cytidylate kinase
MTTLELNQKAEIDPSIDAALDRAFLDAIKQTENQVVVDARMGWLRLPNAFKVRLLCSPGAAVERIMSDRGRPAESYLDVQSATSSVIERRESEIRRYRIRYGVEIQNPRNYDLVVVTDEMPQEKVGRTIIDMQRRRERYPLVIAAPSRFFPTSPLEEALESIDRKGLGKRPVVAAIKDEFFVIGNHGELFSAMKRGDSELCAEVTYLEDEYVGNGLETAGAFVRRRVSEELLTRWETVTGSRYRHRPQTVADY